MYMNMNNLNSDLLLTTIRTDVYCPSEDLAKDFPGENHFDDRSDFVADLYQQGLAILVSYITDPHKPSSGVNRRHIRVSLRCHHSGELLYSTAVAADIPEPGSAGFFRVDFPFPFATATQAQTYRIEVCDEECNAILGEKIIHVWRSRIYGIFIDEWFTCKAACVLRLGNETLYKALRVNAPDYVRVRFILRLALPCGPETSPEFEIRVHMPDGTVESRFCRPVWEEDEIYTLEIPLHITASGKGVCYAEAICMDNPSAGFVFSTDSDDIRGAWEDDDIECMDEYSLDEAVRRFHKRDSAATDQEGQEEAEAISEDDFDRLLDEFIASEESSATAQTTEDPDTTDEADMSDLSDNSALPTLDSLTGLRSVKEKLSTYHMLVEFNRMRRNSGLPTLSVPLHAMFMGSPGTGKTTVASMMGKMLAKAGILSKGHVVVHERATLIGTVYGKEEANTREAIEAAQGGILFIDEAYQLFQPNDPRDPAKFVMEALLTALADESRRDWMLILAGYPDEMKRMFEMNPGLRSRIPESNIYIFDDFSENELMEIAENYLGKNCYTLSPEARGALSARLKSDYAHRDRTFGNARHVINMIQTDIIPAMAARVISSGAATASSLSEIEANDIPPFTVAAHNARRRIGYTA